MIKCKRKKVDSWSAIWRIYECLAGTNRTWIFRGLTDPCHHLRRNFYRVIKPIFKRDPHLKIPEFFTSVFKATRPLDLVYPLNPERLNPRLSIQQGLFLAAGNITKSFEDNFESLQEDADRDYVWQIIIDISKFDVKKEILRNLYRMNVTRAALFPGLDGFAESLKPMLAFPEILRGRVPFDPRITG